MTTLTDRPRTAQLVVDVQSDVVAQAHDRDGVVGRIAGLVDRARAKDVPVVWVQHSGRGLASGTPGWELVPADGEPVVHREYGDSFEDTDLEGVLAQRGVGSLVVTGAHPSMCVRSTLHGAIVRGYDATLVADAHTTEDLSSEGAPTPDLVIAHTNLSWEHHRAPGRTAGIVQAADVTFT